MTKKVTITLEEDGPITITTRLWSSIREDWTTTSSITMLIKGQSHTVRVHAFQEILITEH